MENNVGLAPITCAETTKNAEEVAEEAVEEAAEEAVEEAAETGAVITDAETTESVETTEATVVVKDAVKETTGLNTFIETTTTTDV